MLHDSYFFENRSMRTVFAQPLSATDGSGIVRPCTMPTDEFSRRASPACSHPGVGKQSSSVNARMGEALDVQARLRARPGPRLVGLRTTCRSNLVRAARSARTDCVS